MPTFFELAFVLALATLVSLLMRVLRQPLVVGYIATGIIVGPYVLDLLHSKEEMELFSKIGISILLFIVGLTLSPTVAREVGRASLVTGVGQVVFTSVIGFGLAYMLGFDAVTSAYVAIALTFSSTIIILKLLADRGDLGKLYGKISIGFLLVQDLIATVILLAVTVVAAFPSSAGGEGSLSLVAGELVRLFAIGVLISLVLYAVSKHMLPQLVARIGGNQEVLFLFSVAWGLGLAAVFQAVGFSIEIGSLIAGVMLAVSPFAYEIAARMKPLRDFFILIFFILLGAQMVLSQLSVILVPALALSLFVLVGNPLIVFMLMNMLGYTSKTAFMAGLTVAQISEFSLILASLGYSLGHISQEAVSLVTLVGVLTIAGSTYLILYADPLYERCASALRHLAIRKKPHREPRSLDESPEVLIFGYDRVGNEFVSAVRKITSRFLVVDYNPQSIARLDASGIASRYGDASDTEFLEEVGVHAARLIVSSLPDHATNMLLVRFYRKKNKSGIVVALAHDVVCAQELYTAGASYVVMPHHLGAHYAGNMISRLGFEEAAFDAEKNAHLARLERNHGNHV